MSLCISSVLTVTVTDRFRNIVHALYHLSLQLNAHSIQRSRWLELTPPRGNTETTVGVEPKNCGVQPLNPMAIQTLS